ncbi:MAG TPA: metalloregulator ArsR/SmtB family transcription factor, partial [Candidatus Hydrogenedentes bacterium]|nr:metalloregulator ArsR/SmtB family transcription factor [Candidatus Hydrogenedentota bacterium]
SDPTRRAIFERLCREGEKTVGALTAKAGVSQPVVSKHLGVLKQAGLVRGRHQGRETHYSAQLGALAPLIDWTSQMAGFWEAKKLLAWPAFTRSTMALSPSRLFDTMTTFSAPA